MRIEAKPEPDSSEAAGFAGAIANCWVDAEDLRGAESMALAWLREESWQPVRFDGWELVSRESYAQLPLNAPDRADLLELFDTARHCGHAGAFYGWEHDAPGAARPNI